MPFVTITVSMRQYFLDNSESVNEVIETKSQLIELVVTDGELEVK